MNGDFLYNKEDVINSNLFGDGEENEIFDNVSPDKNYEKGFGCSRKKDEINERIREIDKNSMVDSTALDTVVTFGLK